jgi:hypothetical protein
MPRLRHLAVGALLLPLLGGCGDAPPSVYSGQQPFTAVARFVPGGEVTVIEVTVNDRQPLRAAELVGPGGAVISAESIDAKEPVTYQPPFADQSFVGGPSTVPSMTLPFGGFGAFVAPGSQTITTEQLHSTAQIRLDEPLTYARDWRLWQVRLRIGDPPNAKVVTLPAPQPPAAL